MIWFCSDHHFNHENILKFVGKDGSRIRSTFSTVNEMNEYMIARHNERVQPSDKVYFLGDVGFGDLSQILSRMNGKKRLILGNHDDAKNQVLQKYFTKIMIWKYFTEHDFIVSHVPIHEESLSKVTFNVHGHVHQNDLKSKRHLNICVEKTQYCPLNLDVIVSTLKMMKHESI